MSEDEDTCERFVYVANRSDSVSSLESLQSVSSESDSDANEFQQASSPTKRCDQDKMIQVFQTMDLQALNLLTERSIEKGNIPEQLDPQRELPVGKDHIDEKIIEGFQEMSVQDKQEDEKVECPVCLRVFNSTLKLSNHVESNRPCFVHELESAFSCVECENSFCCLGDWVLHMNAAHGRIPRVDQSFQSKRYLCSYCGFVGESRAMKDQHARKSKHRHFETGPYKCSDCRKECQSVEGLLSHMRAKNHQWRGTPNQSRECRVCGSKFKSVSALEMHSFAKHGAKLPAVGEKEWKCSVCERADFPTEAALQAHMRNPGKQHSGRENPCSCPVSKLRVLQAGRTPDGFIYKAIIRCSGCHRFPVTVPLPADRAMAVRED